MKLNLLQPCLCKQTWAYSQIWPEHLSTVLQRICGRYWFQEGKYLSVLNALRCKHERCLMQLNVFFVLQLD